jgi:hypothetical protein
MANVPEILRHFKNKKGDKPLKNKKLDLNQH